MRWGISARASHPHGRRARLPEGQSCGCGTHLRQQAVAGGQVAIQRGIVTPELPLRLAGPRRLQLAEPAVEVAAVLEHHVLEGGPCEAALHDSRLGALALGPCCRRRQDHRRLHAGSGAHHAVVQHLRAGVGDSKAGGSTAGHETEPAPKAAARAGASPPTAAHLAWQRPLAADGSHHVHSRLLVVGKAGILLPNACLHNRTGAPSATRSGRAAGWYQPAPPARLHAAITHHAVSLSSRCR